MEEGGKIYSAGIFVSYHGHVNFSTSRRFEALGPAFFLSAPGQEKDLDEIVMLKLSQP
jgi:hypothetical protein